MSSIIAGEYAENEISKDFTPSERVAIAKAIEKSDRQPTGQRTDQQPVQKIAQVEPGRKTRDAAAERAGFGNHETYRQAAKVVQNGTPTLIQAMDEGRVSISAASILVDADPDEQEAILELDEKAILQAAKEIRARQAEKRAEHQDSKTVKPQTRPRKERLKATGSFMAIAGSELKKLPDKSVDLILTDPPYPEIDREYGRLTEDEWHELMREVVTEGRRVLEAFGVNGHHPAAQLREGRQDAAVVVGIRGLGGARVESGAGRLLVVIRCDAFERNEAAVKVCCDHRSRSCVWLGAPNCYRNQDNVLWLPSDVNFAESREDSSNAAGTVGPNLPNHGDMTEIVEDRGGSTPFNLLPVAAGGTSCARQPPSCQDSL